MLVLASLAIILQYK